MTKIICCLGMPVNVPVTASQTSQKNRLERIMGTFDLATGHADTFDELLDSLESELRDVLGHYREALSQPEQEPVAWVDSITLHHLKIGLEGVHLVYETEMINSLPLYDKPKIAWPQGKKPWVGLTDEEVEDYWDWEDFQCGAGRSTILEMVRDIEKALKEKNT